MYSKELEGDFTGCFLSGQGSLLEYENLSRKKPHSAKIWRKSVINRGENLSPDRALGSVF